LGKNRVYVVPFCLKVFWDGKIERFLGGWWRKVGCGGGRFELEFM